MRLSTQYVSCGLAYTSPIRTPAFWIISDKLIESQATLIVVLFKTAHGVAGWNQHSIRVHTVLQ